MLQDFSAYPWHTGLWDMFIDRHTLIQCPSFRSFVCLSVVCVTFVWPIICNKSIEVCLSVCRLCYTFVGPIICNRLIECMLFNVTTKYPYSERGNILTYPYSAISAMTWGFCVWFHCILQTKS